MYAPKGGSQVGSPPVTPQTPQPKQEADGKVLILQIIKCEKLVLQNENDVHIHMCNTHDNNSNSKV